MAQRGRRSAADLTTLSVNGSPPRLKPPAYLSEAERKLFTEIVDACDPRQFIESDLPLLISFVQATLMVRDTVYVGSKIVLWEKAVRTQIALATKLRLTLHALHQRQGRRAAAIHGATALGDLKESSRGEQAIDHVAR
ncbi:MAG: hypothetical protein WBW99_18175 [Pseudolabrys sp.]